VSIWIVAFASNLSAYWIVAANAWMQKPTGFRVVDGRAELADFSAVIFSDFALISVAHTLAGAFLLAGFFVMGVSGYHLLRKNETALFKKSFKIGATFALIFSLVEVWTGHTSGVHVAKYQKAKLAAMESLWETQKDPDMYMILIPDEANERNRIEWIGIPKIMKWMAYGGNSEASITGLNDFPREERPPVTLTYFSFRAMVGLGFLFVALSFLAWWYRHRIETKPFLLKLLLYAIPLPYLACELGWMVTEVGRQPWIVYGLKKTSEMVSPVHPQQVLASLIAFILVYSLLGAVDIFLLIRFARKGPEPATMNKV
ncbi:cytochrome ubiquinol oxidase subunit I, partial [bacterium]|nr:cytochrome ubiquinol oxidase subunit I [candidate division CSSED10-310 bacterium]